MRRCSITVGIIGLAFTCAAAPSAQASPAALAAARKALVTDRAEEAFFALEDAPPQGAAEKREYAEVLTRAAATLLAAGDEVFALQLGTKALQHDPGSGEAHLICLQAALESKSMDEAQLHLTALEKMHPEDPSVILWKARLAAADADWTTARDAAAHLSRIASASDEQKKEAATLHRQAEVAIVGQQKKLAALGTLEKRNEKKRAAMQKADQKARARGRAREKHRNNRARRQDTMPAAKEGWGGVGPHVVFYCDGSRHCLRARRRLSDKGISFTERKVSHYGFAADELAELGYSSTSLPLYVMHGQVVYSLSSVIAILRAHGEYH